MDINKNKDNIYFTNITADEYFQMTDKVAYQGIIGSYGHEAAKTIFSGKELLACPSFRDVCKDVSAGSVSAGVLPIENLSAGSVSEVFSLIEEFGLYIVMSYDLGISHCLLGNGSFSDIKAIKSHPQALSQCSEFINENGFSKLECINTAIAAKEVSESGDRSVGVICNRINAELYGLNTLKENISDIKNNKTRFAVVSKNKYIIGKPKKISMVFTLPHRPGSLAKILTDFALFDFNLTRIESAPLKSDKWEYVFYVDIEGSLTDELTKTHLGSIGPLFDYMRITGNY